MAVRTRPTSRTAATAPHPPPTLSGALRTSRSTAAVSASTSASAGTARPAAGRTTATDPRGISLRPAVPHTPGLRERIRVLLLAHTRLRRHPRTPHRHTALVPAASTRGQAHTRRPRVLERVSQSRGLPHRTSREVYSVPRRPTKPEASSRRVPRLHIRLAAWRAPLPRTNLALVLALGLLMHQVASSAPHRLGPAGSIPPWTTNRPCVVPFLAHPVPRRACLRMLLLQVGTGIARLPMDRLAAMGRQAAMASQVCLARRPRACRWAQESSRTRRCSLHRKASLVPRTWRSRTPTSR